MGGYRSQTEQVCLEDLLAIEGQADRLTDAYVVEWRNLVVQNEVSSVERFALRPADGAVVQVRLDEDGRPEIGKVDRIVAQCGEPRCVVRDVLDDQLLQKRLILVPVLRVANELG